MSLQVWLPLNGDLRNQGLSDVQITTPTVATFDNAGKIGKCLLYNNKVSIPATQVASIFNNEHMSIAFWYNNNGGSVSNHAICGFQGNSEGDSGAPRIYDFFQFSSKNDFHWSMGTLGGGVLNGVIPDNTWIHICVIYDSGNLKIYINGILNHDSSGHSSAYTFNKSYYINFGYGQKLNDFRIYDHCLSLKEVKEIAKGLVLHYPLNKPIFNLMPNSYSMPYGTSNSATGTWRNAGSSTMTKKRIDLGGGNYCFQNSGIQTANDGSCWGIDSFPLAANTQFTISCEARLTEGTEGYAGFAVRDSTPNGGYDKIDKNYYVTSLNNHWKVCYLVFTTNSNTTRNIYVGATTGSTNATIQIKNIKIEIGDHPTPWAPKETDPEYAAAGYASGIVYDCSGYQNNGTEVGTITGSSDTPRYRSSSVFIDSCAQYIKGPLQEWMKDNDFSMSCWFYKKTHERTNGGTKALGNQFIFSQGRDWYGSSDTNYYGVSIVSNQGGGILIYMGNTSFTSTINIPLNIWAHVVLTYDGTTAKLYINGELNTSKAIDKSTLKWGNASNAIVIGKMAFNNTDTTTYFPFVGNISDCRVYATALSAADVKALYTDAGYVDKNGNFHAYEFVEG